VSDAKTGKVTGDKIDVKIDGLPRPRFAYAYQLIDDVKGNGDGLVQRGALRGRAQVGAAARLVHGDGILNRRIAVS